MTINTVTGLENASKLIAVSRGFPNGRDREPVYALFYEAADGQEYIADMDAATFDNLCDIVGSPVYHTGGYWTWNREDEVTG